MSALSQTAHDYLRLRRALGHKLNNARRLLPRLVDYLEAAGAESITVETAIAWAQLPDLHPSSNVWAQRMTVARGFARHLAGIDPRTQVPPVGILPYRKHRRVPYLYSSADIAALMSQAHRTIPSPLRAATFETLIGFLAASGVRIGEAIRLDRSDLRWDEGLAIVRESKFGKSRALPLRASTVDALADYARKRDCLLRSPRATTFFVSNNGKQLRYADVLDMFHKLLSQAGVGANSSIRPRLHDLRHTFAVSTLIDWYSNGDNVYPRLPWLATYLGHSDPHCTYWYLSASPELLALAVGRLEVLGEAQP